MNGRWWDKVQKHIYICAYSKTDAARIMNELQGYMGSKVNSNLHEINVYFAVGCWGTPMDGITPERGAWVTDDKNRIPVRIY